MKKLLTITFVAAALTACGGDAPDQADAAKKSDAATEMAAAAEMVTKYRDFRLKKRMGSLHKPVSIRARDSQLDPNSKRRNQARIEIWSTRDPLL